MTTKIGTRMEAVVIYDYAAQESNELTLKKGDIITKIKVMEGGWWEGTTNKDGKRGFFPDNYVKVITNNMNSTTSGAPLRGKKFKVNYNYIPANVDELELHVNDVVEVISEIEEGWWEGKLRNTIGVFPSNFVTEVTEAEMNTENDNDFISQKDNKPESGEKVPSENIVTNNGPVLPPKPKQMKEMCITVFPYEAKHEDELTLKENDVILLLSTDLPDKGWWKGQLNGKIGVFPDNFVKLIQVEDETSSKSEKPSVVKTTNKISDAVPKLPSYTAASLRKSVQPEDNGLSKKPIVSKKPGFAQSSSSELTKSAEKISSSPEKSDKSISSNSLTESPLAKSTLNVSNVSEPVRGKSFSMSPAVNEKLNAEIQATFAAKEADSVDGALNSKSSSYSVTGEKIAKTEPTNDLSGEQELNLNEIERSQVLTHPTASRAKAPKRRPPSGINFKEDDIVPTTKAVDSPKSVVTVNGIADPARDKMKSAAWLQELKLNQAKKNSTQVNVKSGFTITGSNVSFRFQRPVSMYTSETETGSAVFYPKSNVSSSEVITTNDIALPEKSDKVVTISASEWSALNEKVADLELRLEMQNEFFRKTIEQLKLKLAREAEQRMELRNEIDKLMDLVTQV